MANTQVRAPFLNFVNSTKAVADMNGSGAGVATPLNYTSITALRARLTAISGTTYTSAVLDQMSVNDMVYAVRMNDDKTTISNYQP